MSIYGVGGPNIGRMPSALPGQSPVRDGTRPQVQPSAMPVAKPMAPNPAPTANGVPAEAPEGTDPALWSVLSNEERAFFAKAGAMGPLTYGKALRDMTGAQPPAVRGGRLDVKG